MIQNIVKKYFFYLYVFTLCFGVLLYNTTGFKGLDVVSGIILIVFYVIYLIGTKNSNFHIGFLITILAFLFYLNYSFYISDNTRSAISFDFLTQLRPYVTFFIVLQLSPTISESQKSLLKKICFYLWLFFIPIGLYAIVNPSFLSTMMDQPSNYTACITCLSIVYLYCSDFSMKDKLTAIFMLAIGLIVVHSQYYVFFLIACGLLMYFHHIDVLKNNLRTGLALASVAGLIIYISRFEILNYLFPVGVTGNGFASLAIQASGFYSQLSEYGFQSFNSLISKEWYTLSGSYYPILAQFGIIGIMFYLAFWIFIITTSIIRFRQKGDIQPFIIVLILAIFVFVENISDTFFTSNKGYFIMMFLGILLGNPENIEDVIANSMQTTKKNKKYFSQQIIQLQGKKFFLFHKKAQPVQEIMYLTPPIPARKKEPAIETVDVPAVTVRIMPTVKDSPSNELTAKEENKESFTATVNVSCNESDSAESKQQITASIQPSALFVEEDDDYEWEDDYQDEDEWDEEFIEDEDVNEVDDIKEDIKFVASATPATEETVEEVKSVASATPAAEVTVEEVQFVASAAPATEVTVEEKVKFELPAKEIKEEKSMIFSNFLQNETQPNKPAATYTFKQPDESLLKKTCYRVENDENEELSEGAFNYMI